MSVYWTVGIQHIGQKILRGPTAEKEAHTQSGIARYLGIITYLLTLN